MPKSVKNTGMSLIEITIALMLLSLVAVMLLGSITVLSRREVRLVDRRATANAVAVGLLSQQRARVRIGSIVSLVNQNDSIVKDGVSYAYVITVTPGDMSGGTFTPSPDNTIPTTASGNPVANAAVKVLITINWLPLGQSLQRETILAN